MAGSDYLTIASYLVATVVVLLVAGHQLMAGTFHLARRVLRQFPRAHSKISSIVHSLQDDKGAVVMPLTVVALLIFGPFILAVMPPDLLDPFADRVAKWFLWIWIAPLLFATLCGLGWGIKDGLYPQVAPAAVHSAKPRSVGAKRRRLQTAKS